jgi:hypothetical protein
MGYVFVFLLLFLISAFPAFAQTPAFQTDFESAVKTDNNHLNISLNHWFEFGDYDGSNTGDGARMWVDTTLGHSGTKSIGLEVSDISKSRRAEFDIWPYNLVGDQLTVSQWLYLPADFGLHAPNINWNWYEFNVLFSEYQAGLSDNYVRLMLGQPDTSQSIFNLTLGGRKPPNSTQFILATIDPYTLPRGRWFNLHSYLKRDAINGVAKVWIDGQLVFNQSGINTKGAVSDYHISPAKVYYETTDTTLHRMWLDDLKIYQGEVALPTSTTPTPIPTPSAPLRPSASPSPLPSASSVIYSPRVLLIGLDPTDATTGASLANTYFSWQMNYQTSTQYEQTIATQTIQDFKDLSAGRINYVQADHLHLTDFTTYPNGFVYTVDSYKKCVWGTPDFDPTTCDTQKWAFPYVDYFKEHQICEKAAEVQADEIWIMSPPYILAWEAFMVTPSQGYWVNGNVYVVSTCQKPYVVVNATYDRGNSMLHSYAHRTESTIDYLMRNWSTQDRFKYWEKFAARDPSTRTSGQPFCGNTHFPFNFRSEYDFSNPATKASTCADFANFPNYTGAQSVYGCDRWGCDDRGWQKEWLGSIPHTTGTFTATTTGGKSYQFNRDWWYYILYPEHTLQSENSLLSPTPQASPNTVADANGDGVVNVQDVLIWFSNYKQLLTGKQFGDFNLNGKVNAFDFSIWYSNRTTN